MADPQQINYDSLAQKHGAASVTDYDAIAARHGVTALGAAPQTSPGTTAQRPPSLLDRATAIYRDPTGQATSMVANAVSPETRTKAATIKGILQKGLTEPVIPWMAEQSKAAGITEMDYLRKQAKSASEGHPLKGVMYGAASLPFAVARVLYGMGGASPADIGAIAAGVAGQPEIPGAWFMARGTEQAPKAVSAAIKSPTPENVEAALGTGAMIAGGLAGVESGAHPIAAASRALFDGELLASAHDVLNRASSHAKRAMLRAREGVSGRVGSLKNDIAAADLTASKGQPSIPIADLWDDMKDIARQYQASGLHTPKFQAATKAIMNRGGAYLSWNDLQAVRQELGELWAKAPEHTRDAAAVNALRDRLTEKLRDRAAELGREQQFDAYNNLWKVMKGYEVDGVFGKLIDAKGKDFFDVLTDPKNKAELTRTAKSLEQFGFPQNYFKNLAKTHQPLHEYAQEAQTRGIGKLRMIAKHPVVGTAGILTGMAGGGLVGHPTLGGIGGGIAATALMDRLRAASAIEGLGGKPPLTGEMEQAARVRPIGGETPPKPVAPTVSHEDLASALVNLGWKKSEAVPVAKQAAREFPNDFDSAMRRSIELARGEPLPPVSGGSTPMPSPGQITSEDFIEMARRGASERPPEAYPINYVPLEKRMADIQAENAKIGERIAGRSQTKAELETPEEKAAAIKRAKKARGE